MRWYGPDGRTWQVGVVEVCPMPFLSTFISISVPGCRRSWAGVLGCDGLLTSRSHQWHHALINNSSSYYEYTLSNVQINSNSRVLALGAPPFFAMQNQWLTCFILANSQGSTLNSLNSCSGLGARTPRILVVIKVAVDSLGKPGRAFQRCRHSSPSERPCRQRWSLRLPSMSRRWGQICFVTRSFLRWMIGRMSSRISQHELPAGTAAGQEYTGR